MNHPIRRCAVPALLAAFVLALGQPSASGFDEKKPARAVVAKSVAETGGILRREAPDKPWQIVKKGEELYSGDLILGLPFAAIETINGAFRITFKLDYSKRGPYPILESAVVLRQHTGLDLDFFLDRGRVDVQLMQEKPGKFTFGWSGKNPCIFEMEKKGTTVLLETFGRWAPGVPFDLKGGPDHKPLADLIFLVTRGEVLACTREADVLMKAPPGVAEFAVNSDGVGDKLPRFVEKLPEWLEDDNGPEAAKGKERMAEFRKLLTEKGVGPAIDDFMTSGDPAKVRAAVISMAATDDLERLRKTFYTTKSPEVLDLCIGTLRHWLGRDAGHDAKFYNLLVSDPMIAPAQAATALQLLHSFDEQELAQVETYQTLVGYLRHQALGIRGLANYHLVRLYPEGKKFGFNAAGTPEERTEAVKKWKQVLEAGKLPPKPEKPKSQAPEKPPEK